MMMVAAVHDEPPWFSTYSRERSLSEFYGEANEVANYATFMVNEYHFCYFNFIIRIISSTVLNH